MANEKEMNIYSTRALELRQAFDHSFALAPSTEQDDRENVVAFSVAGNRFAVRLHELNGIGKSAKIVPVPSRTRALAGLAGVRGELIPVFSLSELLDYRLREEIHWLFLCGEAPRIGFGLRDFQGCFKAAKSAFSVAERPAVAATATGEAQTRETVLIGSEIHTVISIVSLAQSIRNLGERP